MIKYRSYFPLNIKNNSGGSMPAFAVAVVTSTEITNNEFVLICDQVEVPNTTAGDTVLVVNGPIALDDQAYGKCQWFQESRWFGYDTGEGTPAFGEMWGVENGEWLLQKDAPGITVLGQPDTTNGVVAGRYRPFILRHGETTATFAVASSWETGEQNISWKLGEKTATQGDLSQSSFTLTGKNRSEDASTSVTGVYVTMIWDWYILEWVPVWVDCG